MVPVRQQLPRAAGCLNDAGPDAWGQRVILHRRLGRGSDKADAADLNPITYFLASGTDRIGGLDFQASPTEYVPRLATATLEELVDGARRVEAGIPLPESIADAFQHASSIGGARPKVLLDHEGRKLIAKLQSSRDPFAIIKAEGVAMELAQRCGLNVPAVQTTEALDLDVLLVERFDRPAPAQRRLMVSALTMLQLDDIAARYASYVDLAEPLAQRCLRFGERRSDDTIARTVDHLCGLAATRCCTWKPIAPRSSVATAVYRSSPMMSAMRVTSVPRRVACDAATFAGGPDADDHESRWHLVRVRDPARANVLDTWPWTRRLRSLTVTSTSGELRPPLVMASIISANYQAMAQVLVTSFLEHNQDAIAVVLVIDNDAIEGVGCAIEGATVLSPRDLALSAEDVDQMALAYDVLELATAFKPFLLGNLLARFACPIVYLDADILVLEPLDEVRSNALAHRIVLTPHVVDPFPRDGLGVDEITIQRSGVFNLGFIAVGPGAEPFLEWWAQRTRWDAIVAPEQGLFTDQRWIDQVPALFGHTVVRDRGWNVAYWNAHERPLSRADDGRLCVDGAAVVFFHLSGYDLDAPHRLSRYQGPSPRILLSEHPLLREVCDAYRDLLLAAGHRDRRSEPYGYGATAGKPIPSLVRRMARASMLAGGHDVVPTPWSPDGASAFLEWINRPVAYSEGVVLTRLLLEVWTHRIDLQLRMPDPMGADVGNLVAWAEADSDFHAQYGHLHLPEHSASPVTVVDQQPVAVPPPDESPRRVDPAVAVPDLEGRLDALERHLGERDRVITDLRHRLDRATEEAAATQRDLDSLGNTRLLRWTSTPRALYGAMRRRLRP